MTGDERDLLALARHGAQSTTAVLRTFWQHVQRIMLGLGPGPITRDRKRPLISLLDRVLDRTFGLVQRAALTSDLFMTIVRATNLAAETPFRRAIERLRGIVERRDSSLWTRIRGMAIAGRDDPFLRTVGMLEGSPAERQRVLRAGKLDSNRRWVKTDGTPYRLSDRVWRQGKDVRRQIDVTIQRAIRRGDDAAILAKDLRRFLDPDVTGTHHAAHRLAQTEITHAHGQGVIETARIVPGAVGLRWKLHAGHLHNDACNDHATRDGYGLGPGGYPVNEVPPFPQHPMCRCRLERIVMSERGTMDLVVARYGGAA